MRVCKKFDSWNKKDLHLFLINLNSFFADEGSILQLILKIHNLYALGLLDQIIEIQTALVEKYVSLKNWYITLRI